MQDEQQNYKFLNNKKYSNDKDTENLSQNECPGRSENVILTDKIERSCTNQIINVACSSAGNDKVLLKRKLDPTEEENKFLILDGPIYVRKSALNTFKDLNLNESEKISDNSCRPSCKRFLQENGYLTQNENVKTRTSNSSILTEDNIYCPYMINEDTDINPKVLQLPEISDTSDDTKCCSTCIKYKVNEYEEDNKAQTEKNIDVTENYNPTQKIYKIDQNEESSEEELNKCIHPNCRYNEIIEQIADTKSEMFLAKKTFSDCIPSCEQIENLNIENQIENTVCRSDCILYQTVVDNITDAYTSTTEEEVFRICKLCCERNKNLIQDTLNTVDIIENEDCSCKEIQCSIEDLTEQEKEDREVLNRCKVCCNVINDNPESKQTKEEAAIKKCVKCCKNRSSNMKHFFNITSSEIDLLINSYVPSKSYNFTPSQAKLQTTHGEFGNDKYHFLMVDISTSTCSIEQEVAIETVESPIENKYYPTAKSSYTAPAAPERLKPIIRDFDHSTNYKVQMKTTDSKFKSFFKDSDLDILKAQAAFEDAQLLTPDEKRMHTEDEVGSEENLDNEYLDDDEEETENAEGDSTTLGTAVRTSRTQRSSIIKGYGTIDRDRDKRMSVVSWGEGMSSTMMPTTKAYESLEKMVQSNLKKEELRRSKDLPRRTSIFDEIIKEEKRKNSDLQQSVSQTQSLKQEKSAKSKGWFGFGKKKNKKDFKRELGQKRKLSVIDSDEDLLSNDMGSDISMDKLEEALHGHEEGEKRSSLDSYRRRSSPIENENAQFEKRKEINRYLNNLNHI